MDEESTRKRTRSDNLESTQPTTGLDKVAAATRDSDYWFDDGNLILVSRGVAFRIYKGLLGEHSAIFRSMFHIAQAMPAPEDLVEGCPVIPLDDSPDDLRELFRIIFPLSATLKFKARRVDIAFISAIIRLDHKYELKGLFEEAITYLTTYYTTSFDEWSSGGHARLWRPDAIHAIRAINLARLTNTPSVLPTAFYICATLGPDLVRGFSPKDDGSNEDTERLAPEDLRLVLEMKAHLATENARAAFQLFRSPGTQGCCAGGWRQILEHAALGLEKVPHPLASDRALDRWVGNADCLAGTIVGPPPGNGNGNVGHVPPFSPRTLCWGCRNHLLGRDREVRRQVWRELPGFVGLTIENWDA